MAIRVLNVLNFSNRRNPAGDSGIRLQKELIEFFHRKRPDFFFYLLIPREMESDLKLLFNTRNVQLIPSSCVSRQQGGAYHFDVQELRGLFDLSNVDFDLLFINQPELTPAFLHYFNKVHFFDISSVGYVHWMDWRRYDNVKNRWNIPSNLAVLTSILLSEATGCNSEYGKRRIIEQAARLFNDTAVKEIERKLIPMHPGVNVGEILSARVPQQNGLKTLIAPYRTQKYTGFKSLVEVHLARLWRQRKDFQLVLTNPSAYDYVRHYPDRYPFVKVHDFSRKEYLRALWEADIVVGCHPGASQWSLAVVEALAADCIPLLNQEGFLKEMLLDALPEAKREEALERYFYYRGNFDRKVNRLLDDIGRERTRSKEIGKCVRRVYDWENRIEDWIRVFERADNASDELRGATPVSRKLDNLLRTSTACSKNMILRSLDWHPKSRYISWTRYRKYLRRHYVEDSGSPAVIFRPTRKLSVPNPLKRNKKLLEYEHVVPIRSERSRPATVRGR
jgi:hypothetical protein